MRGERERGGEGERGEVRMEKQKRGSGSNRARAYLVHRWESFGAPLELTLAACTPLGPFAR